MNGTPRTMWKHALTLAAMGLVAASCGGEAETGGDGAETVLSFATYLGPDTAQMKGMEWWADQIEERSDGRYSVEFFYSGALLAATDVLPGVSDGRADIGYTNPGGYHPAELSLSTVGELPLTYNHSGAHMRAYAELYRNNEAFRKQYEDQGVHVLFFPPVGEAILGSKSPLENVGDLDGKQIRVIGRTTEAIKAAGANPVSIPATEIYQSLDQGLIEGYTTMPFETISDLSLAEVTEHIVDPGIGNYGAGVIVMNKAVWDGLPQDMRDLFTEVSEEAMEESLAILADTQDEVCQNVKDAGVSLLSWPDDQVQELAEVADVDSMAQSWIDEQSGNGLPGEEVFQEFNEAYETATSESEYEPAVARCAEG